MDLYIMLAFLGLIAGAVSSGTAIGWGLITAPILLLVLRFLRDRASSSRSSVPWDISSPSAPTGISLVAFPGEPR